MKAVFDTRAESGYDDDIAHRYHFPATYLEVARQAVGDWIIYREPQRNGGRRAYVGVARVQRIEPDPGSAKRHYAAMSDYLPFDSPVPMSRDDLFYEKRLRGVLPSRRGVALQGKSVRLIGDDEFGAIARAGLSETLDPANAIRLGLNAGTADEGVLKLVRAPPEEQERRVEAMLVNRVIRDAAFRLAVLDAYDSRCAVTGLRIVNGGGKAEAQAAHVLPVADGGPDVVQNGIALSGTVHWLFDRHLISLTDDYGLLVSHNKVPEALRGLFARQQERIHLPGDRNLWPHLAYVQRHRERFAAG